MYLCYCWCKYKCSFFHAHIAQWCIFIFYIWSEPLLLFFFVVVGVGMTARGGDGVGSGTWWCLLRVAMKLSF